MTLRTPLGGFHVADRAGIDASHWQWAQHHVELQGPLRLAELVHAPGPRGRSRSHGAGRGAGERWRRHR